MTSKLIKILTGAVVNYDQLPYNGGTQDYYRLKRVYVENRDDIHGKDYCGYILDEQAVKDLLEQAEGNYYDYIDRDKTGDAAAK